MGYQQSACEDGECVFTLTKLDRLLYGATRKELLECSRLLAASLAQHRIEFGRIPAIQALDFVRPRREDAYAGKVGKKGEGALLEALRLIKTYDRQEQEAEAETVAHTSVFGASEGRSHSRVEVDAPIEIQDLEERWQVAAKLVNISWGGAAFNVPEPVVQTGDGLRLLLPGDRPDQPITILSIVVRVESQQGRNLVAVRFASLSTADEEALQRVLLALTPDEVDPDSGALEMAQRVEVECGDLASLQGTLEDIATGALLVMAPHHVDMAQSVQVVIKTTQSRGYLMLRARPVLQELAWGAGTSSIDMYRIGLQFEHPIDDLKARMDSILQEMGESLY